LTKRSDIVMSRHALRRLGRGDRLYRWLRNGYVILMADYTRHQKKIIDRYYHHQDEIMLAKLQEIVTELYLADSARTQDRLWKRTEKAMKALKVPASVAEHILTQRKPEVLARNLKGWLESTQKKS